MGRPKEITDEQIVAAARRCFLEQGAGISTAVIARELGVSHTTLFNRFGSKEALMIAALGPPLRLPWAPLLETGPDERPIRDQLVEIGRAMSAYFKDLSPGFAVLRAAGITAERVFEGRDEPSPVQAYRALSGWLRRARAAGRIGEVDLDALTATILGAMLSWTQTVQLCDRPPGRGGGERFVEQFFELLWRGIAPGGERGGEPGRDRGADHDAARPSSSGGRTSRKARQRSTS
jgi:AcrR family transcriptional regulator